MKQPSNNKDTENKRVHRDTGKVKKTKKRKSRHSDRRAIKDMIDNCKPDEYGEYSDYIGWNND